MPERRPRSSSGSRRAPPRHGSSGAASETRVDRGALIAVYGTRADVGVTAVASALVVAFRSLDAGDVGFAELNARGVAADAKSVTATLDAMRERFTVSVAELGHQVTERTLAAFDVADRILLVTEGAVPSLRGMQRVLRLCRRLNYPDEKMCVVVNRFDAPGSLSPSDVAAALRREVYWKIPDGARVDVGGLAAKLSER